MGIHNRFPQQPGFPTGEIEKCIRDELAHKHDAQAVLNPRATSACEPEINSLAVVEIICAIEEIIGVSLPADFAPRGGYDDVESCVADLLAQTQSVWVELVKKEAQHA
jgi:acyl carrier protein